MLGEAVNEEKLLRATSGITTTSAIYPPTPTSTTHKPLTLIGILSSKTLLNSSFFDGKSTFLQCSGNKTTGKSTRFDVNPGHTHLIIFDDSQVPTDAADETIKLDFNYFRNRLESLFTCTLGYYRRKVLNTGNFNCSDIFWIFKILEKLFYSILIIYIGGQRLRFKLNLRKLS